MNTLSERIGEYTIDVLADAEHVYKELISKKLFICTVESCTGGALANAMTSVPGSSDVLKDSFITYSNEAKIALGVPQEIIEKYTVYSVETAVAMARAGLNRSVRADIGVGVTGSLSRVDPSNPNSVPGEVFIGIVKGDLEINRTFVIPEDNRTEAKLHIVKSALKLIHGMLQ